jgi:hypothetical protein
VDDPLLELGDARDLSDIPLKVSARRLSNVSTLDDGIARFTSTEIMSEPVEPEPSDADER